MSEFVPPVTGDEVSEMNERGRLARMDREHRDRLRHLKSMLEDLDRCSKENAALRATRQARALDAAREVVNSIEL